MFLHSIKKDKFMLWGMILWGNVARPSRIGILVHLILPPELSFLLWWYICEDLERTSSSGINKDRI